MFVKIFLYLFYFIFIPVNILYASSFDNALKFIKNNEAAKGVKIALESNLDNRDMSVVYFEAGLTEFQKQNYQLSLSYFNKVSKGIYTKKVLDWNKGLCFFGMGHYKNALTFLENGLKTEPLEEELLILARVYFYNHKYAESLKILENNSFRLNFKKSLKLTADIYFKSEEYNKVLWVVEKNYPKTGFDRLLFGLYFNAKKELGKLTDKDLYATGLYFDDNKLLSDLFLKRQNYFLCSRYSLKSDINAKSLFLSALNLYNQGLYKESLNLIEKYQFTTFDLKFLKGKILYLNGEYQNAGNVFLECIEFNLENEKAYYFAGESFFMAGEMEKAVKYYEKSKKFKGSFFEKSCEMINVLTKK